jgi:hypothetical protein
VESKKFLESLTGVFPEISKTVAFHTIFGRVAEKLQSRKGNHLSYVNVGTRVSFTALIEAAVTEKFSRFQGQT